MSGLARKPLWTPVLVVAALANGCSGSHGMGTERVGGERDPDAAARGTPSAATDAGGGVTHDSAVHPDGDTGGAPAPDGGRADAEEPLPRDAGAPDANRADTGTPPPAEDAGAPDASRADTGPPPPAEDAGAPDGALVQDAGPVSCPPPSDVGCQPGYDCSGDPCYAEPCGHGSCCAVAADGSAVCICEEGYEWDEGRQRCEELPTPCEGVECSGHGTCELVDGHAVCQCDAGYRAHGLACLSEEETACAPDPEPDADPCPDACTGGCADGTCVVDCSHTAACQGSYIACPDGLACRVECSGTSSCQGARIDCPSEGSCDLQCSGPSSCQSALFVCGEGACVSSCSGSASSLGAQECNSSCACEDGCSAP